jgi:hypothetical protein
MTYEKRSPAALAGAHRARNVKALPSTFDRPESTDEPLALQAAIIAAKYGLTPCIARLICHLAEIGGRLA